MISYKRPNTFVNEEVSICTAVAQIALSGILYPRHIGIGIYIRRGVLPLQVWYQLSRVISVWLHCCIRWDGDQSLITVKVENALRGVSIPFILLHRFLKTMRTRAQRVNGPYRQSCHHTGSKAGHLLKIIVRVHLSSSRD